MSLLRVIVCMAALGAPSMVSAELAREEAQEIFRQANDLFRQGNDLRSQDPQRAGDLYSRAILRFERLIREGEIDNGKLYYNLGNAYFQAGDIGRAILNYRRAERLIPSDENLRQSLRYARSQRADEMSPPSSAVLPRLIFFWHYGLSAQARAWGFGLLSTCFWAGMLLRRLRPEKIPRAAVAGVGGVAALFLGSLIAQAASEGRDRSGVIVAQEVTCRKGDSESYEPAFAEPLHAGAEFRVLEQRPGWWRIELPGGGQCWIPAAAGERVWGGPGRTIAQP